MPGISLIFCYADRVVGGLSPIPLFIFRLVGQTKIIGCAAGMTIVLLSSETYTAKIKSTNL